MSKSMEKSLKKALELSWEYGHEYTTLEHLLIALLDDPDILALLEEKNIEENLIKNKLLSYLENQFSGLPTPMTENNKVTIGFQRVLQRASMHSQVESTQEQAVFKGRNITSLHLLIALYGEDDSYAVYALERYELYRNDVIHYLENMEKDSSGPSLNQSHHSKKVKNQGNFESSASQTKPSPNILILEKYCVNLNKKVLENQIHPLTGRQNEMERIYHILCRKTKNNILLLGESGVGKTALVEGLAFNLMQKNIPLPLKNAEIFSLNLTGLVAGTRFRGDFEERFQSILQGLMEKENAILFVDEAHSMVGTGTVQGGSMDISSILKPALLQNKIRCIAATTFKEFRSSLEKDVGLVRRFQKIDVKEPSLKETLKIIENLKGRFETYHHTKYKKGTLKATIDLSARYLLDKKFPDKALDVLDEAGARNRLANKSSKKGQVLIEDIENTVAQMSGIPSKNMSFDDRTVLKDLEKNLQQTVFGQNKAVETLVHSIKLARSGLKSSEKPIGSYLFSGPTGVGKTEIVRQLSYLLGVTLLRFDMSEYMEKHSVSKLIGAPPGYIGFEQGGLLTDLVSKNPYAIILLDEIEKAHPDILNILLQLMDYGTITDHNGNQTSFRNAILIMTTNAGSVDLARAPIGFEVSSTSQGDEEGLKKFFTPEFRNRLDAIIPFVPLPFNIILKVVKKFIKELEELLLDKNITLEMDPIILNWFADKGFDPTYGARPMARVIDEHLKKPLAEEILFGKLQKGGKVSVSLVNNQLNLKYSKK